MVRRAAITLKLCDHWVDGSLVAAPTSSLPAPVGGVRNWDYRYTWIRDAAFAVFALRRIGFANEADAFLGWVLDAFEQSRWPRIMYTLAGGPMPDEWEDTELAGYRGSPPVRWGNGAADQRQHDVYGEVLDCADQWVRGGGQLEPALWSRLAGLAEAAERTWRQPDQGLWEVRSQGRAFTYSAALCQVALGRAAAIAERLDLPGPVARWRSAAAAIRTAILEEAWDENAQTLCEPSVEEAWTPASWRCRCATSYPQITPAWRPRPGPSLNASALAEASSTATGTTTRPTASPATRAPSCSAASGSRTIWSARDASTRRRTCRPRSVRGQARSACCPSRSTRRRASSPATSRRRSAISV
jgi:hypothetical protein